MSLLKNLGALTLTVLLPASIDEAIEAFTTLRFNKIDLQSWGTRNNFNKFPGNDGLASSVECKSQLLNHLTWTMNKRIRPLLKANTENNTIIIIRN